ncbi:MAG: TetR/AcrR family transcriptional regulator [Vicinamibacterales bacterium]
MSEYREGEPDGPAESKRQEREASSGDGDTASRRARTTAPHPSTLIEKPGEAPPDRAALGRRQRHRLETFERLVAVAREVLFSRDLREVAVSDITDAADVGKGTFFNYFPSKEQVVPGLLLVNQRAMALALERVRRGEATVAQTILDELRAYLCPPTGDWLTYEQNLMQSLLHENVRRGFSERMDPIRQYYIELVRRGQEDGSIRRDLPAEDLSAGIRLGIIGLTVMLWIHGTHPSPALVDHTIGTMLRMLTVPSTATSPVGSTARRRSRSATGKGAAPTRPTSKSRPGQRAKRARRGKPKAISQKTRNVGHTRPTARRPAKRKAGK